MPQRKAGDRAMETKEARIPKPKPRAGTRAVETKDNQTPKTKRSHSTKVCRERGADVPSFEREAPGEHVRDFKIETQTKSIKSTKRIRGKVAPEALGIGATEDTVEPKKTKNIENLKRDKKSPLPRSPTPRNLEPPMKARVLKLLSVNVAGLRAVLRGEKAQTLRSLVEREAPDVLCISEHKLKEEDVKDVEAQLAELLLGKYGVAHWTCSTEKKGYSGVAILLRQAVEGEVQSAAIPDPSSLVVIAGMGKLQEGDPIIEREGRVLTLELPELFVVATYVPNSGMDLQRLSYRVDRQARWCWDRALGQYARTLQEAKSKPVVVIGDLNCCHQVQDIWNMHDRPDFPDGLAAKEVDDQYTGLTSLKKMAGLTPDERKSFPQILADADLVDTFRAQHPDATGVFSYFSQRVVQNRPMNKGLRLDYVLASSSLCTHLKPKSAGPVADGACVDFPFPRIHDSFILDEDELIADHAAIGCQIVLPPS